MKPGCLEAEVAKISLASAKPKPETKTIHSALEKISNSTPRDRCSSDISGYEDHFILKYGLIMGHLRYDFDSCISEVDDVLTAYRGARLNDGEKEAIAITGNILGFLIDAHQGGAWKNSLEVKKKSDALFLEDKLMARRAIVPKQ
jgi:hypothetical protein